MVVPAAARDLDSTFGNVREVVFDAPRELDLIEGKHLEVLAGHVPGQVGAVDADRQEERFFVLPLQRFDGPVHRLVVPHLLVRNVEGRPVESAVHVGKGRHVHRAFPFRSGRRRHVLFERRKVVVPGPGVGLVVVEDLPGAPRPVPVVGEVPGKRHRIGHDLTPPLVVGIHSRSGGVLSGQERGPRRVAGGRGGVGAGEEHALAGQTRKVGGARLRMSAERLDPVVQVVDRDEEDVGPGGRVLLGRPVTRAAHEERQAEQGRAGARKAIGVRGCDAGSPLEVHVRR